ncbi:MAG: hypothetical protein PUE29_10350 [Olsenella sp.]|nr:hypothetical protein [Olsenella sp.]
MAKDRTRHARIREPKQESQADMITLEIGQAFARISEDVAMAIAGFSDFAAETMDYVMRLLEAQNGER